MIYPLKLPFREDCIKKIKEKYLIRSFSSFLPIGLYFLYNSSEEELKYYFNLIKDITLERWAIITVDCISSVGFVKTLKVKKSEVMQLKRVVKSKLSKFPEVFIFLKEKLNYNTFVITIVIVIGILGLLKKEGNYSL